MRILLSAYSIAYGGMERRLEAEASILRGLGHKVFFTEVFPRSDAWQAEMRARGAEKLHWAPYKFVERRHFLPFFTWAAMMSGRAIRQARIELAHIAIPYGYVGMSFAYVLRRLEIPCVLAVHAKLNDRPLGRRGSNLVRSALELLQGAYAVSEPVMTSFQALYEGLLPTDASLSVIHNGIDLSRFSPDPTVRSEARRELMLDDQHRVVVFCGRLDAMKRPGLALEIFSALHARQPMTRLLIVGDGPEMASLRAEIARLGIEDAIRVLGHVSNPARYFAAGDCYLSTSNNQEGFSLTVAEALATGLVAVVPQDDVFTAVYGRSSAVRRVEPERVEEMAAALEELLSLETSERMRLGLEGRAFVQAELSLEIMNLRLASFYVSVEERLRSKVSAGESSHGALSR